MQGTVRPDHVILLDAPVETGMTRARHRGDLDRFEQEAVAFFERIRETYLARAASAPGRYHIVDASQPIEAVSDEVAGLLRSLVNRA